MPSEEANGNEQESEIDCGNGSFSGQGLKGSHRAPINTLPLLIRHLPQSAVHSVALLLTAPQNLKETSHFLLINVYRFPTSFIVK